MWLSATGQKERRGKPALWAFGPLVLFKGNLENALRSLEHEIKMTDSQAVLIFATPVLRPSPLPLPGRSLSSRRSLSLHLHPHPSEGRLDPGRLDDPTENAGNP